MAFTANIVTNPINLGIPNTWSMESGYIPYFGDATVPYGWTHFDRVLTVDGYQQADFWEMTRDDGVVDYRGDAIWTNSAWGGGADMLGGYAGTTANALFASPTPPIWFNTFFGFALTVFRVPQLDRLKWGSNAVLSAQCNFGLRNAVKSVSTRDYHYKLPPETGDPYTDYNMVLSDATVSLLLLGYELVGGHWFPQVLSTIQGTGTTFTRGISTMVTKEIDCTGWVKTYLDNRLNYSFFGWAVINNDYGLNIDQGDHFYNALVSLQAQTMTDARSIISPGAYGDGMVTTTYLTWDEASIGNIYVHLDPSQLTLSDQSRCFSGVPPNFSVLS